MNNEELWQAVLAQIQLNISSANFATWFKNTSIISHTEGEVVISVPNSFVKEWLEQKYNKNIFKILHGLDRGIKELKYIIDKTTVRPVRKNSNNQRIDHVEDLGQLNFQEFKINQETNLNPKYTFENFIVGPFNELPHAAGFAVAKSPGTVYNPLFIYGGVGLGKTHLLQAVGNEVIKNFPGKKVKYIPSEKFTSGVVSSIKNQDIENFKSKYRAIDVLIIDDVQFLAGKEKTQEEFFHIFNALYERNKQIIISSDRPPKAIPSLVERLRSRFEGGMIADISYPDIETRLAILKSKAQEKNISLPEEICQYLASNIQRNIRELEGALNRLAVYQKINNQELNIENIKPLLKNILSSPVKITTPKKVIRVVAEFYDLKEKDLITESRKKEIVRPRQVAMYILRETLSNSYPFIGRRFGGRDHTTAIHAFEKIKKEIEKNENFGEEINLIKERIFSD